MEKREFPTSGAGTTQHPHAKKNLDTGPSILHKN